MVFVGARCGASRKSIASQVCGGGVVHGRVRRRCVYSRLDDGGDDSCEGCRCMGSDGSFTVGYCIAVEARFFRFLYACNFFCFFILFHLFHVQQTDTKQNTQKRSNEKQRWNLSMLSHVRIRRWLDRGLHGGRD
ncbi:unnamed protein product [Vicia faba]|uniref:Transmembrane protein n=1 Tax=Vicia faba TaxID=3906 RepID=A0AAV0YHQ5_VICFA|nr:unnamed protein product [Vicia faba]